ncbi:MAG: class I SAM-dependent methyltransferase [Opitutae bacterium]|nr:class I SAM-dependent methyltransferase [Opitutae bacterium]
MDHRKVGAYWDANADAWTRLARAGYDVYRDHLNTPAFFELLPPVSGLHGLDVGCGEGHNTRQLALRGARITGLDIAEKFVAHARAEEKRSPLGIDYVCASAVELPFADASFDFATAFMALMDIPDAKAVLRESYRVLRPGGFLQFSISHPCFDTPHRQNRRTLLGRTRAIEVGDYFDGAKPRVEEWIFGAAPQALKAQLPPFRIPVFHRTLTAWTQLLLSAGFVIEALNEPRPDDETVRRIPALQDAQVVAYFLHVRVRKPQRA